MKNVLISFQSFLIILALFSFGCYDKKPAENLDDTNATKRLVIGSTVTDTVKLKQILLQELYKYRFSDSAAFTKGDLSLSKIVYRLNQKRAFSEPLNPNKYFAFKTFFNESYNKLNLNIDASPLSVNWQQLNSYINISSLQGKINEGIGIFYLVDNDTLTSLKFAFVVTKAKREVNATGDTIITPLPNSTGKYLMLSPTSNREITGSELGNYMAAYKNNVKFKPFMVSAPPSYSVNNYNHPHVLYHIGDSAYSFYEDNYNPTTNPNPVIVIENGAYIKPITLTETSTSTKKDFEVHVPIILFKQNGVLSLDDIDYPGKPFKNKALDVGRLCPPDC